MLPRPVLYGERGRVRGRERKESCINHHRRAFLHLAGVAAALIGIPQTARAQAYPSRPVRLVVGFPAGGPNDTLGRIIAQWLTERLGQPFVVENQPGTSGNIATAAVVRAPADGYTLLLVGPANAISGSLYPNLEFNFLRDIAPVAGITREALVCWCIRRSRPGPFQSSSPTPKPTPAGSRWRRPATAARRTFRVSSSR